MHPPSGSSPDGAAHRVAIRGFRFIPERLEIASGDTVIWTNEDIAPHTATAKNIFDSKNLDNGQSWSLVAAKKGSLSYICTYHPAMRGELVVN